MSEVNQTAEQTAEQSSAEHKRKIEAKFNNLVDAQQVKFNFKKDDLGNKRPSVELLLPVPSVEGIIAILEAGGKGLELLQEAVAAVVIGQARTLVNEDESLTNSTIDLDKLTWEFIANIEPKERRGGGIPKETWEEFSADYIAVMPAVTGKSADAIGNAAKIFLNKFSSVKTNKPVITLLKDQLTIYVSNSPNAEQFEECVNFLVSKAEKLLTMSDEDLLKNL